MRACAATAALPLCVVPAVAGAETPMSDEIRAIVAEVMADAETRSSLLRNAGAAGHDGRFYLADPSGAFRLNVAGAVQFRYNAFFGDDGEIDEDPFDDEATIGELDDTHTGFDVRRTKLIFTGHAYDPSLVYKIQSDFGDGDLTLEDAYVGYTFDSGLGIYWGQVRLPVLWEDVIGDTGSLAAEKSIVNAVFNPGRSQGVWLHYTNNDLRGWLAFSDGANSANTDLNEDPADWAFTFRGEWKFAGNWDSFLTASSLPGSEFSGKLGAGVHWQDGPDTPGFTEMTVIPYTLDLMLQGDGWNFYAAGIGRVIDDIEGVDEEFHDYGFIAQGGFFIPDTDWELFARYDAVFPDEDWEGDDNFNTVTVGANWFWHGQAARFTFDVQWFLDDTVGTTLVQNVAAGEAGEEHGLLPTTEDDAVNIRAQFQLLF